MKEIWSGFLTGAGVFHDGDLSGVNESCFGNAIESHFARIAAAFASFDSDTKLIEIMNTMMILQEIYNDIVTECHFDSLNDHFTFHSFKTDLLGFMLHFAEEARNIENIWNKTMRHGGLRHYFEFGQGIGEISSIILNAY